LDIYKQIGYKQGMKSTGVVSGTQYAALLGDVVKSRSYSDQKELLQAIARQLKAVNSDVKAFQPLELTIGDEFQGAYEDLGQALKATLLVHLRLVGTCEVRFGIGWGEIVTSDADHLPFRQSGSAWWHAREALKEVSAAESRHHSPRGLRTCVLGVPQDMGRMLEAFLLCRDELLAAMKLRDSRITLGLILGRSQSEIAKDLDISQPAVAQRQSASGAKAIFCAHKSLRGLRP
jgi:SatD family (SatD)